MSSQDLPGDDDAYSEAQFLAGYIALRFRKEPGIAFDHFARIIARTTNPDVKGAGRVLGRPRRRRSPASPIWRRNGTRSAPSTARRSTASSRRMSSATTRRRSRSPEPRPTDTEQARFDAQEMVRAARLFLAARRPRPRDEFPDGAGGVRRRTPIDFAMLAALAESHGRVDLAIAVARRATEAGMPLLVHGYPVTTVPGAATSGVGAPPSVR